MKSIWLAVRVFTAVTSLCLSRANPDELGKTPTAGGDRMLGKAPGEVRDDNGLTMKFVWCPPGVFTMKRFEVDFFEPTGENDEVDHADEHAAKNDDEPNSDTVAGKKDVEISVIPVKVFLTKGYWLGKYEVTQSEWKQVMQSEPWKGQERTKEGADFPATNVSWNDSIDFCRKLTVQERQAGRLSNGWEYTLPTEAQWERGCRARTETEFSFRDDESKLGDYAWFCENASFVGEEYAHRVGRKKPNPWGLYDMHGNVWEWCRDLYLDLPGGRDPEVKRDATLGRKQSQRVLRGGGWYTSARSCRSGDRYSYRPGKQSSGFGFRTALSAVRPAQ